jgi:DNA polymerase III subunit chi
MAGQGAGHETGPRALFYHLTRRPVEETLPALLTRALAGGGRVMLRGTDRARLERLDALLWLGPEEGFLPHGLEGGGHDADQPVLLGLSPGRANGADTLMLIDGAGLAPGDLDGLARLCVLFDGNDPSAKEDARALWRDLGPAGMAREYWSEESGRWQRQQ